MGWKEGRRVGGMDGFTEGRPGRRGGRVGGWEGVEEETRGGKGKRRKEMGRKPMARAWRMSSGRGSSLTSTHGTVEN